MIYIPNYKLPPENDDGNIEYKREILNFEKNKDKYLTQIIYRLNEGKGIAYYYLGVNDNGTFHNWTLQEKKDSLENFIKIIKNIDVDIIYILKFNSGYKIKLKSLVHCNDFI